MNQLQPSASKPSVSSRLNHFFVFFLDHFDRQIPPELLANPESARHARMISRFGLLGTVFGFIYAAFYVLIGHWWGADIILLCTAGVAATPTLMNRYRSTQVPGNFFAFTLTAGFFGLCLVEGGLNSHAIAWLVSVPLCALLLLGQRAAYKWVVISFLTASVVAGIDLAGIHLPVTYNPKWTAIVSTAGYLGLILFMFLLGYIFENGRARAHARMQQALDELAASNERLVHFDQEKNEFLGIAAHDLKNPLTIILANASLLKVIDDVYESNARADVIIAAAERMHQLITNLLDVNKIEQGRFACKLEDCDLNELVGIIADQNTPNASQKQIEIRVSLTENIHVRTDRDAALQILDNLVSNAIKYSPYNSTVHIHTLPEKDRGLVHVRDEGPGISEEDRKKLFIKFSRLSARPTGGESSTGLGLAIAKRLAEALSGSIDCQSTLGAGSTFTLGLPLVPPDPASKTTASIQHLISHTNPLLPARN